MAAPQRVAPLLAIAAIPFVQPNVLGVSYSQLGMALLAVAALLSIGHDVRNRREEPNDQVFRSLLITVALVAASYFITLGITANSATASGRFTVVAQGGAISVISLLAFAIVLRDRSRRLTVARGFLFMILATSCSYVLTAGLWLVGGVGSSLLTTLPVGAFGDLSIYMPLTPTVSSLNVFGQELPRFTGIGREPGWMAMYCVVAFFLLSSVLRKTRWWMYVALAVGLLGTVSTAGFGVGLAMLAYSMFIRPRSYSSPLSAYLRQVAGLAALGAAVWYAIYAPNLGLNAKQGTNALSYDERITSIRRGGEALADLRIFGDLGPGSITLIGSIASLGLLYVLVILAAFLVPRIGHPHRSLTTAPVLTVVVTLLLSQPVGDAVWPFGLVMLTYAVTAIDRRGGAADPEAGATSRGARTPAGRGTLSRR